MNVQVKIVVNPNVKKSSFNIKYICDDNEEILLKFYVTKKVEIMGVVETFKNFWQKNINITGVIFIDDVFQATDSIKRKIRKYLINVPPNDVNSSEVSKSSNSIFEGHVKAFEKNQSSNRLEITAKFESMLTKVQKNWALNTSKPVVNLDVPKLRQKLFNYIETVLHGENPTLEEVTAIAMSLQFQ